MEKYINKFIKFMPILVLIVTTVAYFVHGSFTSFIANEHVLNGNLNINLLLMIVMFGMGLTLKWEDFEVVFTHPRDLIIGEIAQDVIMPSLAFILSLIFHLPAELAAGVILVGCCPGGTSSNVMTYIAKGDVALSVGLTSISTLLSPITTPILTTLLIGYYSTVTAQHTITVDAIKLLFELLQIVVIPIAGGIIINYLFSNHIKKVQDFFPVVSCIAICLILGFVIDKTSSKLLINCIVIIVVILHNMLGYLFGHFAAIIFKMPKEKQKTLAIEVGMQNSGMATTMATVCFSPVAAIPGAVYSIWQNFSGAILALRMRNKEK